MPVYSRASRVYRWVPGNGGSMVVRQYAEDGTIVVSPAVFFDIGQWAIKNIYINENTTHSGDNGGTSRTQVGHDWTFAANVSFPAQGLGVALAAGFIEQLTGSLRGVDLVFNIGEPGYWDNRGLPRRTYRGKALLGVVDVTNPANGTGTVKLNVAGEGDGLLLAQLDGVTVAPFVDN